MSILSYLKKYLKRGNPPQAEEPDSIDAVGTVVDGLERMQAVISRRETVNNIEEIDFTYQGGNFMMQVSPATGMLSLGYPGIWEGSISDLGKVQYLNNNMSASTFGFFFTHRIDSRSGRVIVDMWSNQIVSLRPSADDMLTRLIKVCFSLHRDFIHRIEELPDSGNTDLTEAIYRNIYTRRLVNIQATREGSPNVVPAGTPLTLRAIVGLELGLSPGELSFSSVDIIGGSGASRKTGDEVGDISLLQLAAEGDVTATYRLTVAGEEAARVATVVFTPGDSPGSSNVVLTVTPAAVPAEPTGMTDSTSRGLMFSFVITPADKSGERDSAEAKFMLADAYDKIKDGRESELTPEQRLLAAIAVPDVDRLAYFGTKAFYDGEFHRALRFLKPASKFLLANAFNLDEKQREAMFEILFMTGLSFSMVGNYEQAFFYLDPLVRRNNIEWIKGCITALMGSHDFRAKSIIEGVIDSITGAESHGQLDDSPELDDFKIFLNYHLAVFYVEDNMPEEAETLLRPMLGGAGDTLARRLLARIEQQRGDSSTYKSAES